MFLKTENENRDKAAEGLTLTAVHTTPGCSSGVIDEDAVRILGGIILVCAGLSRETHPGLSYIVGLSHPLLPGTKCQ